MDFILKYEFRNLHFVLLSAALNSRTKNYFTNLNIFFYLRSFYLHYSKISPTLCVFFLIPHDLCTHNFPERSTLYTFLIVRAEGMAESDQTTYIFTVSSFNLSFKCK